MLSHLDIRKRPVLTLIASAVAALMVSGCAAVGESSARSPSSSAPNSMRDDAGAASSASPAPRATTTTSTTTTSTTTSGDSGPEPDLTGRGPLAAVTAMLGSFDRADLERWAIPNAAFEPRTLDLLTRLAGGEVTLDITRNDGVRADVVITAIGQRAVVTLVRWEGQWRLGAIVELIDAPPLIIVDAEARP